MKCRRIGMRIRMSPRISSGVFGVPSAPITWPVIDVLFNFRHRRLRSAGPFIAVATQKYTDHTGARRRPCGDRTWRSYQWRHQLSAEARPNLTQAHPTEQHKGRITVTYTEHLRVTVVSNIIIPITTQNSHLT